MELLFLASIGYAFEMSILLLSTIKIKSINKDKKMYRYIVSAVINLCGIIYYVNVRDMTPNILSWIIFIRTIIYVLFVMVCAFIEIRIESKKKDADDYDL